VEEGEEGRRDKTKEKGGERKKRENREGTRDKREGKREKEGERRGRREKTGGTRDKGDGRRYILSLPLELIESIPATFASTEF
jgi:hypothetical protein